MRTFYSLTIVLGSENLILNDNTDLAGGTQNFNKGNQKSTKSFNFISQIDQKHLIKHSEKFEKWFMLCNRVQSHILTNQKTEHYSFWLVQIWDPFHLYRILHLYKKLGGESLKYANILGLKKSLPSPKFPNRQRLFLDFLSAPHHRFAMKIQPIETFETDPYAKLSNIWYFYLRNIRNDYPIVLCSLEFQLVFISLKIHRDTIRFTLVVLRLFIL